MNLPDSGSGVQMGGPPHFYVVTNTGKWDTTNKDLEPTNHTIEGVEITPSPAPAVLTGVTITKTNGAILVFWGATGIATTSVDGGAEAPTDSGVGGGGPDAGGGAGSGGGPLDASTGSASGGAGGTTTSSDAGTTSSDSGGAAPPSGSDASGSGSNTKTSSGSSNGGCSLAPTVGTGAGWGSLAALAWFALAGRRPRRKFAATNASRSTR
jgi:hypothetical protein